MSAGPIAIVDYGMGNLRSVQNAVEHVGGNCVVVDDPAALAGFGKIILPGVGAFAQAIACLHDTGMTSALNERREAGAQILGICLGMQLMCRESDEDGLHRGLGWFDARVEQFDAATGLSVPHMGWNSVTFRAEDPIFSGLDTGGDAYFVHSYHVRCESFSDVLATTDYGIDFHSMIRNRNLRGIQFHPEKSQELGLALIRNYLELPC
jgi:imidazole glycerol-phosphate synthase subunit HisH